MRFYSNCTLSQISSIVWIPYLKLTQNQNVPLVRGNLRKPYCNYSIIAPLLNFHSDLECTTCELRQSNYGQEWMVRWAQQMKTPIKKSMAQDHRYFRNSSFRLRKFLWFNIDEIPLRGGSCRLEKLRCHLDTKMKHLDKVISCLKLPK